MNIAEVINGLLTGKKLTVGPTSNPLGYYKIEDNLLWYKDIGSTVWRALGVDGALICSESSVKQCSFPDALVTIKRSELEDLKRKVEEALKKV